MDRVVVLGGYGRAGRLVVEMLAEDEGLEVVVAGRNEPRAQDVASTLARRGRRVFAARADAGDGPTLRRAICGARLLVVASSSLDVVEVPMDACLAEGVDYFDLQIESRRKERARSERRAAIGTSGRCFVTDGGFHPGLPAVLVRHAMARCDALLEADVGSFLKVDWREMGSTPGTAVEFARELLDMRMEAYRFGGWRKLPCREWPTFDAGAPFGAFRGVPMRLAELVELVASETAIRKTGFYLGGSAWMADWLVYPGAYLLAKLGCLAAAGRVLKWGLSVTSHPPFACALLLDAVGTVGGEPRVLRYRVRSADGYRLTAAPAVACIRQMLRDPRPGLWRQGLYADPESLLGFLRGHDVVVESP